MIADKQEIFNRVATHLLKQGKRSVGDIHCAYRGGGNLQCAVGCLIEDQHYNPDAEQATCRPYGATTNGKLQNLHPDGPGSLLNHEQRRRRDALFQSLKDSGISTDNETLWFLDELQTIHDIRPPRAWEKFLRWLAKEHNLTFNMEVEHESA